MAEATNEINPQGHVIIVAHNNRALTVQTLRSALKQDIPVEVILIDNASTDGTREWARSMEAKFPNVDLMPLTSQKSLAACWNMGLESVWQSGGTHALVLNNDVVIHPRTYGTLLCHGGMFVTTVSVDDEEQFHFTPGDEDNLYAGPEHDLYIKDRPHPNFSGFLIRKSCFDRVGPFNEDYYPAYCEDAEYHIRMHRQGVRAVCIDLPMLHLGNGANTLRFADPAESNRIKRGADANRLRFRDKYGCVPGDQEYNALFSDATFGIDQGNY